MIDLKKSQHEKVSKLSSNGFLETLQNEHGYCYFEKCVKELPCIDWLDFASRMYRLNSKQRTVIISAMAMCRLNNTYNKGELCRVLTKIIKKRDAKAAVKLIDDFVGYCVSEGQLNNGTIRLYSNGIKRVLQNAGVKIDKDDFKEVKMPKPSATLEEYPTNEEIVRILNCCSQRVRTFVMLLCDSGLGRSEVIRLRPKDFDFTQDPVIIRTFRFKTGEQLETTCTKVTAETVQQLIRKKNKSPTDCIFAKNGKIQGAVNRIAFMYGQALKTAGLNQKLEVRKGDNIQEHKFFKFHLHVLRKRWFTKAIMAGVPVYVVHGMLGRKQYLQQYLAVPPDERRELHKKILRHVSIFETKADKAELLAEASKILGFALTEEKLDQLKQTLQFAMKLAQPKNKELLNIDKQ